MNNILYEFLDKFVIVYLYDIVIYTKSLQVHVMHLVFSKLRKYVFYVKREKCEFCKKEIKFLQHIIS